METDGLRGVGDPCRFTTDDVENLWQNLLVDSALMERPVQDKCEVDADERIRHDRSFQNLQSRLDPHDQRVLASRTRRGLPEKTSKNQRSVRITSSEEEEGRR